MSKVGVALQKSMACVVAMGASVCGLLTEHCLYVCIQHSSYGQYDWMLIDLPTHTYNYINYLFPPLNWAVRSTLGRCSKMGVHTLWLVECMLREGLLVRV